MKDYTDTPLHPEVQRVLDEEKLPVKQILQHGPRYAVVSTEADGQYAIFKMVIPEARGKTNYSEETLVEVITKEAALLSFLGEHKNDIRGLVTPILRHSKKEAWYLRGLLRGRPMASALEPFPFDPSFFEATTPEAVFEFFHSLHKVSAEVPPRLAGTFVTHWPKAIHHRRFVDSLSDNYQHPLVAEHHEFIADFVYTARRFLSDTAPVITHQEAYASHIFVTDGRIGLIDWENASWGHRLHDLSTLWMRWIDHPDWQRRLEELLDEAGYFDTPSERMIWDMELLVKAISNLNWFHFNPMKDPVYGARANDFFVATVATVVERYK